MGAVLPILLIASVLSVFFFSSRRRHTRCYRDWSSDVCSSDLFLRSGGGVPHMHRALLVARGDALAIRAKGDDMATPEGPLIAEKQGIAPRCASRLDVPHVDRLATRKQPLAVRAEWRAPRGRGARNCAGV